MHQLPYGRNANRADYASILKEKKGTCSTKHATLAALAHENHQPIDLNMVICKIDKSVDNNASMLLKQLGVSYFPEAHCYLSGLKGSIDITFPEKSPAANVDILISYIILPGDIGMKKTYLHHRYINEWMQKTGLAKKYSFKQIWDLRETWIQSLSM